jgi:hypothetical protein
MRRQRGNEMKKIARISTAAFRAGATTLAVTMPMPVAAGVQPTRVAELPVRVDPAAGRD